MLISIFTIVINLFSFSSNTDKATIKEHKSINFETRVENAFSIKGQVITDKQRIDEVLSEFLAIRCERKTEYVYNPINDSLVMYFKGGINQLEVTDCKITPELTNFYISVNKEIKLHITYYNNSNEIVDIRVRQFSEEWNRYFEVVTL